MGAKRRLEQG